MGDIEEVIGVSSSLPPQKATKPGGITEKVGRERLVPLPAGTPSVEQARVASTTFKSYLFNKVGSISTFPIQLVEAARLGTLLEEGLTAFEKGNPFHFISKNGESMTIQPGEKMNFSQSFISLLSSLLQKAEGSPQQKSFFYALVNRFVNSNTFRSTNRDWENTLKKEREALSKVSESERSQAHLEHAFKKSPSLDTLADLIFISSPTEQQG